MNQKFKSFLQFVFSIGLVLGLVYGTWRVLREFIDTISAASPEVSAAIIGAMATVLVGVAAVLLSQAHERKRSAEEAHRLKKVQIYEEYLRTIASFIGSSNENLTIKALTEKEMANYFFKFKSDILLWGSPKVIKAQLEFEKASSEGSIGILKSVNRLYAAIRDDIGLSNSGLNNFELVKLYLNQEGRSDTTLK